MKRQLTSAPQVLVAFPLAGWMLRGVRPTAAWPRWHIPKTLIGQPIEALFPASELAMVAIFFVAVVLVAWRCGRAKALVDRGYD